VAAFGSMAQQLSSVHGVTQRYGLTKLESSTSRVRLGNIRSMKSTTELQLSMSGLVNLPRGGAISTITAAAKNWNSSPSNYFNTSFLTLAILTMTFKLYQRASSSTDVGATVPTKPKGIKDLQMKFLSVFWLLRCADWLQGPYFYEVYASKVFNGVPASLALISQLFLTGFASTALFGPSVGRALDSFGRKKGTVAFSIIYAIGALSTKSPLLQVLFFGRIMSGIGTSLLFSAPESWLVGEAQKSGDDPDGSYLGETFGLVSLTFWKGTPS